MLHRLENTRTFCAVSCVKKRNAMPVKSATLPALLNLFFVLLTLTANYLANALPIAGRQTGEVSGMYPTLFTPAGFTFAIWGLIYLLLLGFAGYQTRYIGRPMPDFLKKTNWWFALSCLANAAWLPTFHYLQFGWSLLIILVLLGSLITVYLRLDVGRATGGAGERWLVHLPFSVYLGWVSVATIANTSIWLSAMGWAGQPLGPVFWTVLVIAAATGVGLWALFSRRDVAFAGVLVWALYGIWSKRQAEGETAVATACLAAIAVLVAGGFWRFWRR